MVVLEICLSQFLVKDFLWIKEILLARRKFQQDNFHTLNNPVKSSFSVVIKRNQIWKIFINFKVMMVLAYQMLQKDDTFYSLFNINAYREFIYYTPCKLLCILHDEDSTIEGTISWLPPGIKINLNTTKIKYIVTKYYPVSNWM